jgi:hypothetical protein
MPELPDYSCEEMQKLLAEEQEKKAALDAKFDSLCKEGDKITKAREAIRGAYETATKANNWAQVKVIEKQMALWAQAHKALTDELERIESQLKGARRAIEQLEQGLRAKNCAPVHASRPLKAAGLFVAAAATAAAVVVAGAMTLLPGSSNAGATPDTSTANSAVSSTPKDSDATPTTEVPVRPREEQAPPTTVPAPKAPRVVRNETPIPVGSGVAGSAYRDYNPTPQVAQPHGQATDSGTSSSSSVGSSGSSGTSGSDGSTVIVTNEGSPVVSDGGSGYPANPNGPDQNEMTYTPGE